MAVMRKYWELYPLLTLAIISQAILAFGYAISGNDSMATSHLTLGCVFCLMLENRERDEKEESR